MLATAASVKCGICNQALLPGQALYRNGRYQQHLDCGRMQDRANALNKNDQEANKSNSSQVKVKAKVTVKVKVQ